VIIVGLLACIGFTPLSFFWFNKVSGLSVELTQFALTPVKILTVMPGLWMILSFQRSILVSARQTSPTTWATGLELLIVLAILFVAIVYLDFVGAIAAATAFLLGRIGGILGLVRPFSRVVKTFE
jgi:O-antigen/teichoic acid export membrane protein